MEHVLVTGGAGFIGTALIKHLNEHGYETSCIDKQPQPLAGLHVQRDLLTPQAFEIEFEKLHEYRRVDRVIHLAAQVGRLFGEDDIRYAIRENAEMTTVIARKTAECQVPMVYTSTSEVYGDQGDVTCFEDEGPWGLPHNLYGLSKRWGEETCRLYNPLGLVIWRPSMPYGPGAPPGRGRRAMDNMLWQANTGQQITVHRGSERSWCWLGDTVEAMRLTLEKAARDEFSSDPRDHLPKAYNIGRDDDPRTMLEIAEMSCDLAGAPYSLITQVDPPENQTAVKRLATYRVRELGWEPKVKLEDGIKNVFEWIKRFDAEGRLAE